MKLAYVLLVATWLVLLAITLHLWVVRTEQPPIPIIALLAAVSLVPLAGRLRIGNWFDFTKKVDRLSTEVDAAKENMSQLSAQLTNLSASFDSAMVTTQAQQQIVASLPDPKTAKAFARALTPRPEKLYPPSGARDASRKSRNVVYFLWAADEVIAWARPSLQAYYVFVIRILDGSSILKSPQVHQPAERIIQEIRRICTEAKRSAPVLRDEALPHLDALAGLIDLRHSVASGEEAPPSIKEGRVILSNAAKAAAFFAGAVGANADVLAVMLRSMKGLDSPAPPSQ